jgi:hypothetical protein
MANKKSAGKFIPFTHDDLELKNQLIGYARLLADKTDAEAHLACAMIYASFAEYVAGHLLDSLRHLVYQTTYNQYAGILFIDERKVKQDGKGLPLGALTKLLQAYVFPDKDEIITLLQGVTKSRNNLFHNFARADADGFGVFDDDILMIKNNTEEVLQKVNTIYAGLGKILVPQEASMPQPASDGSAANKSKQKPDPSAS